MTQKELSQLYHLNREIEQDKQKLSRLYSSATSTTSCITGMPHAAGISDKTAYAAEIAYLKGIIENKIQRTYYEYNRLVSYINGIPDSETRQILTLYYVNGMSWQQVAFSIGYQDESVPRKKHNRFLSKMTEKSDLENV